LLTAKRPPRKHHASLPFANLGTFMLDLRGRDGVGASALEFAILTAARTNEALGARWPEIDMSTKVWTVPGARMKSGREHRVPLSDAAMAVLEKMRGYNLPGEFIFPNISRGRPLSNMVLLNQLKRMDRADITTHGFRATFKTWGTERTNFANEIIEAALAHVIGDKTEQAYSRGDLIDKRRRLMDSWAEFCAAPTKTGETVIPMRSVN
jgi:integrase